MPRHTLSDLFCLGTIRQIHELNSNSLKKPKLQYQEVGNHYIFKKNSVYVYFFDMKTKHKIK